jgi:hypothetical protein
VKGLAIVLAVIAGGGVLCLALALALEALGVGG